MNILGYNKEKKVLSIQFNTGVIWEYKDVTQEQYTRIQNITDPKKMVKSLLYDTLRVGIYRGAKV